MSIARQTLPLKIPVRRKLPLVGGYTSERTGEYAVTSVTVEVDFDKIIAHIGERAALSKSGVSKFMHGAVVARRVGPKPIVMIEPETAGTP